MCVVQKSELKQRRGKQEETKTTSIAQDAYDGGKAKGSKVKTDRRHGRMKKRVGTGKMLLFMTGFLSIVGGILYYFYSKYGINIFIGHGALDFKWSPYEWRKFIDDNDKTILLIGGPHRSGTTILWEAIKAHPEVVGFGDRSETGVDYSEGVLFQEVYPRFGVGLEFKKNFGAPKRVSGEDAENGDGMGRYALAPGVHWTKENHKELLEDASTLSKLLNRFAPYWDTTKSYGSNGLKRAKVWVEKSPQNAVLSSFLEGLYNMQVKEDGSVEPNKKSERTVTKFLYVTRHPIANTYAVDKFVKESMGGYIDFEVMFRNYIQLHKYMKEDENAMDSPAMWAKLEDFTQDPTNILKGIFQFLEVSTDDEIIADILDSLGEIRANPNAKYNDMYCSEGIQEYGNLAKKYEEEFKALNLGYELDICY